MNVHALGSNVLRAICIAAFTLPIATGDAYAQASEARKEARKAANRFLTFLEIPARRTEGAMGLLKIGEHAVPTLMRGALHPNPEIACMSMQVLGELGAAAMVAEGTLHKLSLSDDPIIASAGGWAKVRVRNQGAFLVTDYSKGSIREFTPNKDKHDVKVLLANVKSAWDAERLGNGNLLVTQYSANKVVEYDLKSQVIWEFKDVKMPLDADRLPNGNTLICDTQGGRVIEVNSKGEILWTRKDLKQPYDADRLVDGNTLISEYGKRVIEVDPDGKIVWTYDCDDAFGADRLPNGNTLITSYSSNEVLEVDPKGDPVLTISGLKNPNEARRLANGNTVVALTDAIATYDKLGKEISRVQIGSRPGTVNFH